MTSELWPRIKEVLRETLPRSTFHSFVEPVTYLQRQPKRLDLKFRDEFSRENFETKCLPAVQDALRLLEEETTQVLLEVESSQEEEPTEESAFSITPRSVFQANYSFDTFVTGASNQFAHAACQAVAKQPGLCYNPLFIFGGAGLGKTHLLKAIGNTISSSTPASKILFLTSESFTNELIHAIRVDKMREFRDKYRQGCDILLLDDIHFLAGKERTQEEFFYTFNYLHEARKQIVITSDRYPKDIQGLENRLLTRFEWGLVADVQPPEMETRIAILKNKADHEGIPLPDDVAAFIAGHYTSNIRELEGSLHRLQAYAALNSSPISLELAKQIFRDFSPGTKHEITADGILKLVALQFNIRAQDILSEKKARKVSEPRQICMYLLRRYLQLSYPEIGKFLGRRNHTTVMHAVQKVAEQLCHDEEMIKNISAIENLIR